MFDTPGIIYEDPAFTNFKLDSNDEKVFNAGLLDNSIIPMLDNVIPGPNANGAVSTEQTT
jgi:hypothetical protein